MMLWVLIGLFVVLAFLCLSAFWTSDFRKRGR
jgi:hypothetical protein